jgi:hypothetical protein
MKKRFIVTTALLSFMISIIYGQNLIFPKNENIFQENNLFFTWDGSDILLKNKVYHLIIKEILINQDTTIAMKENKIIYEIDIKSSESVNINLKNTIPNENHRYVWQIITYDSLSPEKRKEISRSIIRTFTIEDRHDITQYFSIDGEISNKEPPRDTLIPKRDCVNGNVELGTFQGWEGYYGSRSNSTTVNLNNLSYGIVNGRHTIRSTADGFDGMLGGSILSQVGEGNFSIRLGNSNTGGEADVIKYSFVVNSQNQIFNFKYALVLVDPVDHQPNQKPFFSYYILKGTSIFFSSSNMPVVSRQIVADSNNPFFKQINGYVYRDWTPCCIDLSSYMGQTMTIVFVTADCSLGGHCGYAYIDALCGNNEAVASFTMPSEICINQPLIVDGSASINETSYFWSIEESDANGGRPNPSSEVSGWVLGQQVGIIDYKALYNSFGRNFICNKYYRIKLAVNNDCTPWNEMVKILHIRCPQANAGNDLCVSCKPNGHTVQLGSSGSNSNTYSWSPSIGLHNQNSSSPFHQEGSTPYPITYTLTVTDEIGCTNTDQVTLYCNPPQLHLSGYQYDCCYYRITANAQNYDNIVWSTGASGVLSIDVMTPGTYTVVASNVCGQVTESFIVPNFNITNGPYNVCARHGHKL